MDPIEMEQIRKTAKLHNMTLEEYLSRKTIQKIPCGFYDWCLFSGFDGCGSGCEKYQPDGEAEARRKVSLIRQYEELKCGVANPFKEN